MKRYEVNRETLRTLYPAMDERFERNMRAMIDTLPRKHERRRAVHKPRYALAFALLLALIAVTALAAYVVTNGFFAEVAQMHISAGAYDNWTLAEKESIVHSMKEYGILQDAEKWKKALAVRHVQKREEALDALFAEHYGVNGRTDVITAEGIINHEIGQYDSEWSLEKKAEYCRLMLDLGLLGYDSMIDVLPGENDITQQEAEAIARAAVIEAYGLEDDALDAYEANLFYQVHRKEIGVKPPYYMVELFGADKLPYWVYVSGDGRVLGKDDGYAYIDSPAEEAARLAAKQTVEEMPEAQRLQAHIEGLALLDTQSVIRESRIADGALGLSDGTAVVYGRMYDGDGNCCSVYAECMDETGTERWMLELKEENGESFAAKGMMQTESGDLLCVIERRKSAEKNGIEYMRYDQLRIGQDGTLKERKQMKPISELTGMRSGSFEQMFADRGHGGMLVVGYMSGKNIPAYVQLDESGEPMFMWTFEELLGYAPYLKVTDDGYVLCAWNEAANMPILRFYDKQGTLIHEAQSDPALEGLRINRVKSCANGDLLAASNFMEDGKWMLARIDPNGSLVSKQVYEDSSGPILGPSEIVCVGERTLYACNHHLSAADGTQHTGVIMTGADGTIREYSMEHARGDGYFTGYVHLAPVGKDSALLVYTFMDMETERRSACLSVIRVGQ